MKTAVNIIGGALVFNLLDIATGLFVAIRDHSVQSGKLRDGLFKKVGFIVCYVLACLLDKYGYVVGIEIPVSTLPAVCCYVIITEVVSIIENVCKLNPDILPSKLLSIFQIGDNDEINKKSRGHCN